VSGRARARVGIAFAGDVTAPGAWSGIPYGVAGGLRAQGVEAVPLRAEPPRALMAPALALAAAARRSRVDAAYVGPLAALRSAYAGARVRALREPLDGIVQMGSEFALPAGIPYVPLLDMTVVQARAVHPVFARLSEPVFERWRERQRRQLLAARACCAASGWTADSIVRDHGVPRERVHVVGFGRNHEPPPAGASRDWSAPRFLFVGREWERKNGDVAVRAFGRLRAERPDATLDLVGGHPRVDLPGVTGHGSLRLGVEEERRRLDALYAAATCFVMPSHCEPFGMAYAEAAAAGVPSIGTTVGGAGDVVGPDGGVLVPPGDEDALLDAMRRLADPETARAMGAAARARAERFTWPAVAERLLRALGLA
jgi:glycosyltransferase involved in cell wall biosynthesis